MSSNDSKPYPLTLELLHSPWKQKAWVLQLRHVPSWEPRMSRFVVARQVHSNWDFPNHPTPTFSLTLSRLRNQSGPSTFPCCIHLRDRPGIQPRTNLVDGIVSHCLGRRIIRIPKIFRVHHHGPIDAISPRDDDGPRTIHGALSPRRRPPTHAPDCLLP